MPAAAEEPTLSESGRQGVVDLEEEEKEGKNSNTWPLLGTGEIVIR